MSGRGDIARAFANAGASSSSEALTAYLDAVACVMAEHKRETVEAMGLRPGDAAVDVGCGTGDEVRLIAERVGPSGRAVGVDVNGELLAAARERTPQHLKVAFVAADAHALPFAAGEFAAARVERALQHMVNPGGVVAEMARIVCPGGRVVALEPDWETLVISSGDRHTTRAILDQLRTSSPNPTVGRNLARYFADAGIALETVDAKALVIRDPAAATRLFLLDDAAKRVRTKLAAQWLADLGQQTPQGGFCAALTQFAVVGTRLAD
jgi:SAM-dependent methyltransferase